MVSRSQGVAFTGEGSGFRFDFKVEMFRLGLTYNHTRSTASKLGMGPVSSETEFFIQEILERLVGLGLSPSERSLDSALRVAQGGPYIKGLQGF